jgi:serine/threonine-protein kinase
MVGTPDAADRFRHEALVAASFAHPNVVTVYDFGITDNARGYLVMERLNGATLRETLRRDGPLTRSRTGHVMRGVCQAVDAAHRRQLIHRDLKPDNIFLTRDDVPKVLDFGIAKFVSPTPESTALTATGASSAGRVYGAGVVAAARRTHRGTGGRSRLSPMKSGWWTPVRGREVALAARWRRENGFA